VPPVEAVLQQLEAEKADKLRLARDLEKVREENALLRKLLLEARKKPFEKGRGEQIDERQLEMLLGADGCRVVKQEQPAAPVEKPEKPSERKTPRRIRLPEDTKRIEKTIEPDEVLQDPDKWKRIGEERTERVHIIPAQFVVEVIIRGKYVHIEDREHPPVIAPLPPTLVDRSVLTPSLASFILLSKYVDHQPLYRLEKMFRERHQVDIPRRAMCGWLEQVAEWLKPIYNHMRERIFSHDYIQADETFINYLDPDYGLKKARSGYLWAYAIPGDDIIFDWKTTRGRTGASQLKSYKGKLQSDGYKVYETLAGEQGLMLFGCWAHARRKVHEALKDYPRWAALLIRQIQLLYAIEKRLREQKAGPALREAVRQSESTMILRRIHAICRILGPKTLPKDRLGKAIAYILRQWKTLERFAQHGEVEIDNNGIENSIRPTAVGKKNYLFIGSPRAGHMSAIFYSIIESCRRHDINPAEYIRDVLERLPSCSNQNVHKLVPKLWKETYA